MGPAEREQLADSAIEEMLFCLPDLETRYGPDHELWPLVEAMRRAQDQLRRKKGGTAPGQAL